MLTLPLDKALTEEMLAAHGQVRKHLRATSEPPPTHHPRQPAASHPPDYGHRLPPPASRPQGNEALRARVAALWASDAAKAAWVDKVRPPQHSE